MTPQVSVFTPTHGSAGGRYLRWAYRSLIEQTFTDWEWVVAPNNGATPADLSFLSDPRVKVVDLGEVTGVGEAKRGAVEHAEGRLLVELDQDDRLTPDALSELHRAFQQYPDASLFYSRFAQIQRNGTAHPQRFEERYGWSYDETEDGLLVPRLLEPTPHNVSLIWYAPNHVRAFPRWAYDKTSGYDPCLVILDDLALMSQLYQVGEFRAIDRLLYLQRIHGANTQLIPDLNQKIQTGTWDLYEQNILRNVKAWSSRRNLRVAESLDEWRTAWHLDSAHGGIRIYDPTEPIGLRTIPVLWESLAPNGLLMIMAPESGVLNRHMINGLLHAGLFQESRFSVFEHEGVPWIQANLITIKAGYTREGGLLHV